MKAIDFTTIQKTVLQYNDIQLRVMHALDFDFVRSSIVNEPQLWDFAIEPVWKATETQSYFQEAMDSLTNQNGIPFVIENSRTNEQIGSSRLYHIQERSNSASLGYTWYLPQFQGTGINAICKYLLLEFALETLQLSRIEFRADERNLRSIAAMKKIGCTYEGTLRSHHPIHDGSRRNTVILSILKTDWEHNIRHNLSQLLPTKQL